MLMLTEFCPRSCEFCFAGKSVKHNARAGRAMSLDFVKNFSGELQNSGAKIVSLGGGEPLLNPEFIPIARFLLSRGFGLKVFTGGPDAPAELDFLSKEDPKRVSVLLNLPAPGSGKKEIRESALAALEKLGRAASPGFTISSPLENLGFIIDDAEKCGSRKIIRLGIAHPDPRGRNYFLSPGQYKDAGTAISRFTARAKERGFKIAFDCGFVKCMFPSGPPEGAQFFCSPVLDVWPDGKVTYCLALSGDSDNIEGAGGLAGAKKRFISKFAPYMKAGLFNNCRECAEFKNSICRGGCVAQTIRSFTTSKKSGAVHRKPGGA
jgi:radical SAM protein with 4Fe4S-binding SPASM domain